MHFLLSKNPSLSDARVYPNWPFLLLFLPSSSSYYYPSQTPLFLYYPTTPTPPPPSPPFRMQYGESEREMASFRKVLHAGRTILFSLPHFHEILRFGKIWVFGIGGHYPNVTIAPVSFDLKNKCLSLVRKLTGKEELFDEWPTLSFREYPILTFEGRLFPDSWSLEIVLLRQRSFSKSPTLICSLMGEMTW